MRYKKPITGPWTLGSQPPASSKKLLEFIKMSKFIHYPDRPKKLTAEFAKKEYQKLLERLPDAEGSTKPDLWLKLFADWNALESYIGSEAGRISYNYSKDMSDRRLELAERYIREKISVVIDKPGFRLTKAFLASKHRNALSDRYGTILPDQYELWLEPLNPVNTALGIKTGNLAVEYEKMVAEAIVEVGGEKINLSKARSLWLSPDGKLREEAYRAVGDWFLGSHQKTASIYSAMVSHRHQMGINLGYKNFIPLAYKIRGRMGYGVEDVADFRSLIKKHVVPAFRRVLKERAKLLGQKTIKPWDLLYDPRVDMPLGSAPIDQQLDNAQKVFESLSPVLADHFKNMRRGGLIDLENRPNKQAGAYCTQFSDEERVVVFCNSTGDADDIRVLVHEMGHAFQSWESQKIEAVELQMGSAELAEIYSMGMEFLSLPHSNEFFGTAESKKFTRQKWIDSLYSLCYICVVDEFQHWVYQNPKSKNTARDEKWIEIYTKYLPEVSFSGIEKYAKTRWYLQRHIFIAPFYYIDYALAEVIAIQLAMLAAEDPKKTIRKYLALCKVGGTKSFLQTVNYSGLKSPFNAKLIVELVAYANKQLD